MGLNTVTRRRRRSAATFMRRQDPVRAADSERGDGSYLRGRRGHSLQCSTVRQVRASIHIEIRELRTLWCPFDECFLIFTVLAATVICILYIRHDTVIAIVTIDPRRYNNNGDTSMACLCLYILQVTCDTHGRTRWIAPRLSQIHGNMTYQECYLACVRNTSGRAMDPWKTFAPCVMKRPYAERQQSTLHEVDARYATTF